MSKEILEDTRWPGNVVHPSSQEQKVIAEANLRYKQAIYSESVHGPSDEKEFQTMAYTIVDNDAIDNDDINTNMDRIRNKDLKYFPGPHHFGHDHRLGFRNNELIWRDERTKYWRGLQGK